MLRSGGAGLLSLGIPVLNGVFWSGLAGYVNSQSSMHLQSSLPYQVMGYLHGLVRSQRLCFALHFIQGNPGGWVDCAE